MGGFIRRTCKLIIYDSGKKTNKFVTISCVTVLIANFLSFLNVFIKYDYVIFIIVRDVQKLTVNVLTALHTKTSNSTYLRCNCDVLS